MRRDLGAEIPAPDAAPAGRCGAHAIGLMHEHVKIS
jgi:hypothetical protein